MGVDLLFGQVESNLMGVGEIKATDFNGARWVSSWLQQPLPTPGNRRAIEFMNIVECQKLISKILNQSRAGVYA